MQKEGLWTTGFLAVLLFFVAAAVCVEGCRESQQPGQLSTTSNPVKPKPTPPPPTHETDETPRPPLSSVTWLSSELPTLREGWVIINKKNDTANRAWVEGSILGEDKIVIGTENVRRFQLDLSRLRMNWEKRIVLRIDGFNSELTRKHWPIIPFQRTSSGAWTVVETRNDE